MSLQPLAFVIDPLLSEEECAWIVDDAKASGRMDRATVLSANGKNEVDPGRSSSIGTLPQGQSGGDPVVRRAERRAHWFVNKPTDHGEELQVNHYLPGERFNSHTDFFPTTNGYKHRPEMQKLLGADGTHNRFLTMLWYLESPAQEGETHFPNANGGLDRNIAAQARMGAPQTITDRLRGVTVFALGKGHGLQCDNITWGLKVSIHYQPQSVMSFT